MKSFLAWLVFAPIALYVTGWSFGETYIYGGSDVDLSANGFAFRIGDSWYGGSFEPRFFDAPILSWIGFGLSTGVFLIPFGFVSN